jgi:GntR family uxuAB operon transcriptional repressor
MTAVEEMSGDLVGQVVGRVEQLIAGTAPGSKLPTERRLAEDLNVSRTLVRQALSRLEASGMLSREVGRGTFVKHAVARTDEEETAGPLADVAPADVMAARTLIEPAAMGLAVVRATERDLSEMRRCLQGGDDAISYPDFESWDCALHHCLIGATRNPLIVDLYSRVEAARLNRMWGQLKRRSDSAPRRALYRKEHHAIVAAVEARDAQAAIEAMRRHLESVSQGLFGRVV